MTPLVKRLRITPSFWVVVTGMLQRSHNQCNPSVLLSPEQVLGLSDPQFDWPRNQFQTTQWQRPSGKSTKCELAELVELAPLPRSED